MPRIELHPDYHTLDEVTSPIQSVIRELQQFTGSATDEASGMRLEVEEVGIKTPVELDVHVDKQGKVILGTVSRHITADISFEPVLHGLKLNIVKTG